MEGDVLWKHQRNIKSNRISLRSERDREREGARERIISMCGL